MRREQDLNQEIQAVGESQQKIKKKKKKRQTNALGNKDVNPGDEEDISSGKKISILKEAVFDLKTDSEKIHFVSKLVCPSQERKRKKQKKRKGNALGKKNVNPGGQEDSSSSNKMEVLEDKDVDPGGEEDISSNKKPFIIEDGINMCPEADSEKFHLDSKLICPLAERRRKKCKKRQGSAVGNNDVNHSGQEDISSIKTTSLGADLKMVSEKAHVESELIPPPEKRKRKKKKKRQGNSSGNSYIYHGTQKNVSSTNPTPFITEPVINTGPTTVSEMAQRSLESCPQEEKKKRKKQKKQGNTVANNDMNHYNDEDFFSIKITYPVTEAGTDFGLKDGSEKSHLGTELIHPAEKRKRKKQKKRRGNALENEDVNNGGQGDASSIQTTSHVTDDEINIGTETGSEIVNLALCHPSGEKMRKTLKKMKGNSLENNNMNHGAEGGASSIKINSLVTENTGLSFDLEKMHLDSEPSHLQEERKRKKVKKRKGNALGNNKINHVTEKDTSLTDSTSLVKEDWIDIGSELSNPTEERTGKKQKKRQENAPGNNEINHCSKKDPSLVKITSLVMEGSVDTGRQNDSEMGHPELGRPPGRVKIKKRKKKSCSALKNDDKENVSQEENSTRKDASLVDSCSHKQVLECSEPQISELNTSSSLCTEKNEGEPWSNRHDSSKNNEANCDSENDGKPVLEVAGFESTNIKENCLISHEVGLPKHLTSVQQDFDTEVDQILPDTQNVETNQRKKKTIITSHNERGMPSFSVNDLKTTEEQALAQTSQDHSYREHAAVVSEIKLDVILEGSHVTSAKVSEHILQKKCTANGSNSEVTSKEVADRMEMNPEEAIGGDRIVEDLSVLKIYEECIEERNNRTVAEVSIPVQNKHEKDDSCNKCLINCKRSCDDLAGHDFSCTPRQKNAEKETKIEEGIPSLSSLNITKDSGDLNDADKQDNFSQILHSLSERPCASHSKRKLLVLDLNGLLADIVPYVPYGYRPYARVSGKSVFKRPSCEDFLAFCFKRFDVGIWSSRLKKNVDSLVHILFRDTQHKLLFCWDASHCTRTGLQTIDNKDKPLVLKELKVLWEYLGHHPSLVNQEYNESNTLLVDDSPYKALRNPAHTGLFPYSYQYKDVRDSSLGPEGDLRLYLERLAVAENVQKFVEQNPFGQRAITESDPSWDFYSRILSTS